MATESFTKQFILNNEQSKAFSKWLANPNKKEFILDTSIQFETLEKDKLREFLKRRKK